MSKSKVKAAPAKAAKPAKAPAAPVKTAAKPAAAKRAAPAKPAAKPSAPSSVKPPAKKAIAKVATPAPKPTKTPAAQAPAPAPKATVKAVAPQAPAKAVAPVPSKKVPVKTNAAPASSATPPAKASSPAATAPAAASPVAAPRAAAKGKSSRHDANTQPVPAAPIHPANRFADRFAPAKPSARYLPEPMVDTKPAAKPDPKLANAWKSKAGRDLTEPELLAMPEGEYMNDKQVEFFKARLSALKEDLLSNAGETTEHLREDTTIVPDPADRATIEEEHALELRTRDRERKLLRKISQSLSRIDAGEYGYCEETGEPIGLGRLLARPTATLSLEAQQRRELKQRMFGD